MRLKMKHGLISLLLCSLLFVLGCVPKVYGQEMYTITPAELTQLETNLNKLESINKQQQAELKLQKSMLNQAKFDLEELQVALSESRMELTKAQQQLETANKLLLKYEQEEKSKLRKVKIQRGIAYTVAAGLAYVCVRKVRT